MLSSKFSQLVKVGLSTKKASLVQNSMRMMATDFKDKEKGEEKVYFNKKDCKFIFTFKML
jgi:hypothetical protein